MPAREKGQTNPGSQPPRPFSRPSHPQTAAKVRGLSLTASGFTTETDWLLEESGFEPSVPPATSGAFGRIAVTRPQVPEWSQLTEFVPDSPLEEGGFELEVPL